MESTWDQSFTGPEEVKSAQGAGLREKGGGWCQGGSTELCHRVPLSGPWKDYNCELTLCWLYDCLLKTSFLLWTLFSGWEQSCLGKNKVLSDYLLQTSCRNIYHKQLLARFSLKSLYFPQWVKTSSIKTFKVPCKRLKIIPVLHVKNLSF